MLLLAEPVDVSVLAFDEFDPFPLPYILKWNTEPIIYVQTNEIQALGRAYNICTERSIFLLPYITL